jgi:hypothetical protein
MRPAISGSTPVLPGYPQRDRRCYPQILSVAFRTPLVPESSMDMSTTGIEAEGQLGRVARGQAGIFTRSDAEAAGFPAIEIRRRLRSGLWVAEFGSGLRAATTPNTVDSRERAALARAGVGAALSHFSAARRWRLLTPDSDEVWVTVGRNRNLSSVPGMRVVRSRHVPASAVRRLDGIPVLEPARTVADLARYMDGRRLTAIALAAMQRDLCTHAELVGWQRTLAGRPGSADLRAALHEADPAFESILSAEFGRLTSSAGLTLFAGFELRLPDGGCVVCDFADPVARIDFEIDGFAYHSTPAQVARDRARDRRLLTIGWVTVRYDTNDVRRRATDTLADALRHIARRRPSRD